MIIRCDNCSVSLQLDDAKIPGGNFTVRCPRCQNAIRVQPGSGGKGSVVQQLQTNKPAQAVPSGAQEFASRESEFELNTSLKSLLFALQKSNRKTLVDDSDEEKPRRALLCLGKDRETAAKILVDAGYKVYLAQTPAQANERLREGKTEILIFSPDFAAEFGGATILQQKINSMISAERRRLYFVSLEENGTTMSAHEAFLRNLNLIVNVNDIDQLALILNRALRDFNDLYHYYNNAISVPAI